MINSTIYCIAFPCVTKNISNKNIKLVSVCDQLDLSTNEQIRKDNIGNKQVGNGNLEKKRVKNGYLGNILVRNGYTGKDKCGK